MSDNTHHPSNNQIKIKLRRPDVDERLAFVDRVCSLMIDGRYAPERTASLVVVFSDKPEREEALFYDMTVGVGMVPSYPLAEIVNERCSPSGLARGVSLASRLVIHDAALAAAGYGPIRPPLIGGPSP